MGKQYKKINKRRRRHAYLARKKAASTKPVAQPRVRKKAPAAAAS